MVDDSRPALRHVAGLVAAVKTSTGTACISPTHFREAAEEQRDSLPICSTCSLSQDFTLSRLGNSAPWKLRAIGGQNPIWRPGSLEKVGAQFPQVHQTSWSDTGAHYVAYPTLSAWIVVA